jgi:hypothetical protein
LRELGCLNPTKQNGELFLNQFVAAQEGLKRVHQEHLDTNEFGKNVQFHFRVTRESCIP